MWIRLTVVGVLAICAGCGGQSGPKRWAVQGTVKFQSGTPVDGSISFLPAEGHKGPAANGAIKGGRFSIPQAEGPTSGKHQVIVSLVAGKMASDFAKGPAGKSASKRTRWEFKSDVSEQSTDFKFALEE